ncbi:uncharacterized protein LOC135365993 [Ornithodoros turicata]|uniref:uncharacterized protein LOC135365993 n=1 Tax=Ornithodoros turicata TaxID=34597 RepID=UPI0031388735
MNGNPTSSAGMAVSQQVPAAVKSPAGEVAAKAKKSERKKKRSKPKRTEPSHRPVGPSNTGAPTLDLTGQTLEPAGAYTGERASLSMGLEATDVQEKDKQPNVGTRSADSELVMESEEAPTGYPGTIAEQPKRTSARNTRIFLLSAVGGAVLVSVLFYFLRNSPWHGARVTGERDWCGSSKNCHDAERFFEDIIDWNANPCTDFYQHICNRWTKPTRFFNAYLDEVLHELRNDIYVQLDRVKDNLVHRDAEQAMSVFFKSCKKFIIEKKELRHLVNDAVTILRVNVSLWKSTTSFQDIFPEVVRLALEGAPSVVQIRYKRPRIEVYFDMGPSLSTMYGHAMDDMLRTYVQDVIKFSGMDVGVDATGLDQRFSEMYARAKKRLYLRFRISQLKIGIDPGIIVQALRNFLPKSNFEDAYIRVQNLGVIRNAFRELSNLGIQERSTYLVLLAVSHLLTHDFTARYNLFEGTEQRECLRITSEYFSRAYFQAVVNHFLPYNADKEVSTMEAHIRRLLLDGTRTSSLVSPASRDRVARGINTAVVWLAGARTDVSRETAFQFLDRSFISNVAMLLKEHVELRDTEEDMPLSQWQYNGTFGYVMEKGIVLTVAVLRGDIFYGDDSSRLNYATVGTLLAEGLVQAGLDGVVYPLAESEIEDVILCYKRHIGEAGANATDAAVRELVALKLALNTTCGVNRGGLSEEDTKKSDQMFFRRFCLINCGRPSGHRYVLPGKFRCNFVLSERPEFAKAFDCSPNTDKCPSSGHL